MEFKELQIRLFNTSKPDKNGDTIIDYSKYSSDLFIREVLNTNQITKMCADLCDERHADLVFVWSTGRHDEKFTNQYDKESGWKYDHWLIRRENHLDPEAVYTFDLLLAKKEIGIVYDRYSLDTILNIGGNDHHLGQSTMLNSTNSKGDTFINYAGRWIWSESEEDVDFFIKNWKQNIK